MQPLLPTPQVQIFGGGAHAGRRTDIQDFMVVCPGAKTFAQAIEWTAEVYRHAGLLMRARGATFGVADEGGWWPVFNTNEQALEALVAAIERAATFPASRWRSRSTSPPAISAAAVATRSAWSVASSTATA